MSRRGTFLRGPATLQANLTPLVDVTFLLIVFFVLVSQITNSQVVEEVELPEPEQSVSLEPDDTPGRMILNILAASTQDVAANYQLGTTTYQISTEGLQELTTEFGNAVSQNPDIILDIRADRKLLYRQVYPAMQAATNVGVQTINLMVAPPGTSTRNNEGADQ